MKNSLVSTFALFLCYYSFSQDLVVTSEGDSLNCKITKLQDEYVYFTFIHKDEIRSTLLPLNQVKSFLCNYFPTAVVPVDRIIAREIYSHWRFGVNVGWSYQTADVSSSVPSDFKKYVEDLKSGYHYAFEVNYFITEPLGIGFKYVSFHTSNNMKNIFINKNGHTYYGNLSDNLSITFIGPAFCTRLYNTDKKSALLMNLALGYLDYHNKKEIVVPITMSGSSLGLIYDIGYDIAISENYALGFQLSFLAGALSSYEWKEGNTNSTIKLDKDSYESMNRIDISIGLRFNSKK